MDFQNYFNHQTALINDKFDFFPETYVENYRSNAHSQFDDLSIKWKYDYKQDANSSSDLFKFDEDGSTQSEKTSGTTKKIKKQRKNKTVNKSDKMSEPLKGYPTKNLLTQFRYIHFQYLKGLTFFDTDKKMSEIKNKKNMSLKDYQYIYTRKEFQDNLLLMFEEKALEITLLESRVNTDTKYDYFQKIHVFEQAFKQGQFTHIN